METMEENMIVNGQELAEATVEKVTEAMAMTPANPVTVTTQTTVPPISQPKSYTGKNVAIGVGLTLGGGAIGFALDHWVVPFFSKEQRDARKAKRAEKKAAKEAKKAGKGKGKEKKPAKEPIPAPKPDEPDDDGIDPETADVTM